MKAATTGSPTATASSLFGSFTSSVTVPPRGPFKVTVRLVLSTASIHPRIVTMVASPTSPLRAGASSALGVLVDLHDCTASTAATLSTAISIFIEHPPSPGATGQNAQPLRLGVVRILRGHSLGVAQGRLERALIAVERGQRDEQVAVVWTAPQGFLQHGNGLSSFAGRVQADRVGVDEAHVVRRAGGRPLDVREPLGRPLRAHEREPERVVQ